MKERLTPKLSPSATEATTDTEVTDVSSSDRADPAARARPSSTGGFNVVLMGMLIVALLGIVGFGLHSLSLRDRLGQLEQVLSVLRTRDTNAEDDSTRITAAVSGLNERMVAMENKHEAVAASVSAAATQRDLRAAVETLDARIRELRDIVASATATTKELKSAITEPAPGAQQAWAVHLATLSDPSAADKFVATAEELGINVQRETITVGDKTMYRMSIRDIVSYDDAEKLAAKAQQRMKLAQKPWIAKQ